MCDDVVNHKWSLKLTGIPSKENITSKKKLTYKYCKNRKVI